MTTLSTHVLDTSKGRPATGMVVRLARWVDERWMTVGESTTDQDGRVTGFGDLEEGRFRLGFETGDYGNEFYPFIHVVFTIDGVDPHYHVPLLLSPYGYSTYRGS
jgi:5-hydroxyisourate hydrolase